MGADLDEREVAEGEAEPPSQCTFNALDLAKRLPGVGAFVVAVLEEVWSRLGATNVVDAALEPGEGTRRLDLWGPHAQLATRARAAATRSGLHLLHPWKAARS